MGTMLDAQRFALEAAAEVFEAVALARGTETNMYLEKVAQASAPLAPNTLQKTASIGSALNLGKSLAGMFVKNNAPKGAAIGGAIGALLGGGGRAAQYGRLVQKQRKFIASGKSGVNRHYMAQVAGAKAKAQAGGRVPNIKQQYAMNQAARAKRLEEYAALPKGQRGLKTLLQRFGGDVGGAAGYGAAGGSALGGAIGAGHTYLKRKAVARAINNTALAGGAGLAAYGLLS